MASSRLCYFLIIFWISTWSIDPESAQDVEMKLLSGRHAVEMY